MANGAKLLIESLEKNNVKVVFGISGYTVLPIYDALLDSNIRHILVRHEQCASHMADGFARTSGNVGVCMATSGPGATNLVTGVATAYLDSSPILAISATVTKECRKYAFQEVDINKIYEAITKRNYKITSAKDIPKIVNESFFVAKTGRPGPVLINIPMDVQNEKVSDYEKIEVTNGMKGNVDVENVKRVAEVLYSAEKPLILVGSGVITSNASEELVKIAELLRAPVATSLMGKGSFPEDHVLSLGVLGVFGKKESNHLVKEADVILAVGTRFSDSTSISLNDAQKIIYIDIDPSETKIPIEIKIKGDAKESLEILYNLLSKMNRKERESWKKEIEEVKKKYETKIEGFNVPGIMKNIRKVLPRDAIIATEVGQNQVWAEHYFDVYNPRTFMTSGGLGTMGFGFPASLGAKVARPDKIVVDIAGDGSFIMNEQDLATSVTENIPVIVCVLNNSSLGMVAQWQRMFFGRRYSAVKLGKIPDFVKLAESYGANGIRAVNYQEIDEAVKKAMKSDVTTVIDIPINPEEDMPPTCSFAVVS